MIQKTLILLLLSYLFSIQNIQAQNIIKGIVTDSKGLSLPHVSIVEKGTINGTQSDFDGRFRIPITNKQALLVFSYVGFTTQDIKIDKKTDIKVELLQNPETLDEVVVTALGISRKQRSIGYAVSKINGEALSQTTQVNPVNALQGKVAGVQVSPTSGGTYGSSRITIRGNATFGSNTQPIFIIDGIIMDNDIVNIGADWGNQLKNLNADDFESVTILKGAAASALYGSRAIHGVVLITTKSGKKTQSLGITISQTLGTRSVYDGVDFQNQYGSGSSAGGFSFVDNGPNTRLRDDKHDTSQFFAYDLTTGLPSMAFNSWEEHAASWGPKFDGQNIIDYDGSEAKWLAQPNNYKDTFNTGIIKNLNVAIDGGSETNTFRLSVSDFSETGVTPRNDFKKNAFSLKTTQDLVKDKLKVSAIVHYTKSKAKNPLDPKSLSSWFHDGFPRNYDVNKWKNNYTDIDGGIPYPAGNNYNYTRMSKLWMGALDDENSRIEHSLLSKINIEYNITKNIKTSLEGNINQYSWDTEFKTYAKDAARLEGAYSIGTGEKFQNSISGKLFFNKNINERFRMDLILGGELWQTEERYTNNETNGGFKTQDFFSLSNSKNPVIAEGGLRSQKQINSLYSFFSTSYNSELYFILTARNDWSSALVYPDGNGNNSYFYPSASLSWVVNETFKLPKFVSFMKFRNSYAIVGNDTDSYKLSTGFRSASFPSNPDLNIFQFEDGTAISTNLKPEKKFSFETGMELHLFKNRVVLDVAYYKDNNKNQIIALPTPIESGIENQLINAGNLQNSGVEASLDVNIINSKDFNWSIGLNYTRNRDKIIALAPGTNELKLFGNPDDAESATASYAYVGGNYGDLVTRRGYTYYEGTNNKNYGIPILANRNGWSVAYPTGIQNKDSLHVMGNMQADWYGGANTSIRYKGFQLSAIIDARFGGEIYSSDARYGLHQGVLKSSLPNRDASQGGMTWTSQGQGQNFYGKTYDDGYIPNGVFPDGTTITSGLPDNRTSVDVGGLTYLQAYNQGLVEPTHWSGYIYRWTSASTGTPITGVYTQKWIGLREVTISYHLPSKVLNKLYIKKAKIALTGRDLGFLYNSMPDNINPIISGNEASNSQQLNSAPYVRSITFSLKLNI